MKFEVLVALEVWYVAIWVMMEVAISSKMWVRTYWNYTVSWTRIPESTEIWLHYNTYSGYPRF